MSMGSQCLVSDTPISNLLACSEQESTTLGHAKRWALVTERGLEITLASLAVDLVATSQFVVLLGCGDALEKLSVRDSLVVLGHADEVRLVAERVVRTLSVFILLSQQIPSKELVELVLVDEMALVLHRLRVGCLVDELGHEANLLHTELELFVLGLKAVKRLTLKLLHLTGSSCVGSLLLLDLSQLDLLEHLVLS